MLKDSSENGDHQRLETEEFAQQQEEKSKGFEKIWENLREISKELSEKIRLNFKRYECDPRNNGWIYAKIRYKALICIESIIEGNSRPLEKMSKLLDAQILKQNLSSIYQSYKRLSPS